ncbi:MAG: Hpt domain-containing protein [Nitrospinae bacterium]|nr:Hpt domain-containing protein [Nitrospinota bacterium]
MTQNKNEKIIVHVDADIEELVPGFLQNRHEDVKTILDALEKGDYETIRIAGHTMKGSGGGYGFDAITDMGHSIEEAALGKNSEEIKKQLNELSSYLDSVEVVYE